MRSLGAAALALTLWLPMSGCSGIPFIGGDPDLTTIEVAGRYEFVEFTLDPVSAAVRDYKVLGEEVSEDLTMVLSESGEVRLERLRGDRVDEVMARGRYEISGRTVRVQFDSGRDVDGIFLPREVEFEGGGERLRAEVFREGVNLERISGDYRGITRADVVVRIDLREIG